MNKCKCGGDLLVQLSHNYGDICVELADWVKKGPGERPRLAPFGTVCKQCKTKKGTGLIPFIYRNGIIQRFLIIIHVINDPWKKSGQNLMP